MSFARTVDTAKPEASIAARLGSLLRYPSLVWQNRYTVQNFFQRELMGRFHGSFLGAWWMLVQPLFMFAVYFLVFGVMFDRTGNGPSVDYALYLFSGVIVFHALTEATSSCCNIIVQNGNLVKKVAFPSEVLPVHVSMISVVLYLIGAVVCLTVGVASGQFGFGVHLLGLPLVVLVQFIFVLGLGMLLANANVFVRDVSQLWRIISMAWMFTSPVFWTPDMIVEKLGDKADILFTLNPAYSMLMAQRYALAGPWPNVGIDSFWGHLGAGAAWAVGLMVVGYVTFVGSKRKHADIV
ncbi:MAG: ABC transporter permease [Planctomycetota bacterium]